jgi:hypothetical protein
MTVSHKLCGRAGGGGHADCTAVYFGPVFKQLSLGSTMKYVQLTGYCAAPAIPTPGIVDIFPLREQPARDGVAHILLGESLVHPLILLCLCPVVAPCWTCTHSRTISMLQSWLPRRVDGTCAWPGGDAPNIRTHAHSSKAMLPLVQYTARQQLRVGLISAC